MAITRSQAPACVTREASPERRCAKQAPGKAAASKRKLFEAEPKRPQHELVEDMHATPDAPQPADPAVAPSTVAGSLDSYEPMDASRPNTPPTPPTVGRVHPGTETPALPPALGAALEPAIAYALQRWRANLVALQPRVQISDSSLHGAIVVMRAFAAARPDLHATLLHSVPHLLTYTAVALWTTTKANDLRPAIPNRTLMSQACQIHPQALSDFEIELCASLDWGVAKVLRDHDLLQ